MFSGIGRVSHPRPPFGHGSSMIFISIVIVWTDYLSKPKCNHEREKGAQITLRISFSCFVILSSFYNDHFLLVRYWIFQVGRSHSHPNWNLSLGRLKIEYLVTEFLMTMDRLSIKASFNRFYYVWYTIMSETLIYDSDHNVVSFVYYIYILGERGSCC